MGKGGKQKCPHLTANIIVNILITETANGFVELKASGYNRASTGLLQFIPIKVYSRNTNR